LLARSLEFGICVHPHSSCDEDVDSEADRTHCSRPFCWHFCWVSGEQSVRGEFRYSRTVELSRRPTRTMARAGCCPPRTSCQATRMQKALALTDWSVNFESTKGLPNGEPNSQQGGYQ
jgi:hypothetical protein